MFLNQMTPNHKQTLNEEVHCTVILTIEYMYFPFFSMQSLMMKVNVCNQSLETQITMLQFTIPSGPTKGATILDRKNGKLLPPSPQNQ